MGDLGVACASTWTLRTRLAKSATLVSADSSCTDAKKARLNRAALVSRQGYAGRWRAHPAPSCGRLPSCIHAPSANFSSTVAATGTAACRASPWPVSRLLLVLEPHRCLRPKNFTSDLVAGHRRSGIVKSAHARAPLERRAACRNDPTSWELRPFGRTTARPTVLPRRITYTRRDRPRGDDGGLDAWACRR